MSKVYSVGKYFSNITGPERDEFIAELCELSDNSDEDIVLDFSGVDSIGSIALAAIGKMQKLLEDKSRKIKVKGLSPSVYRMFEFSGFTEVMQVEKKD